VALRRAQVAARHLHQADPLRHGAEQANVFARIVTDEIWTRIREEAARDAVREPMLASFLYSVVLNHDRFEDALSFILASKLGSPTLSAVSLRDLIQRALAADSNIGVAARADIDAVMTRDPACLGFSIPLLYFKGYHAIQSYRVAHHYWTSDRKPLALYLQSRISEVFAVDIHPGARLGKGLLFDHATSIVIGETCVIEDDFSMLHEVTLGGTGKAGGDRHPKIRRGVLIGAGAKVLGNVVIGEGAKIGAGSVVLQDVPPHCTVAGVPAKPVGVPSYALPALEMDQALDDSLE
jgi:serine O-acetyltransferase